MKKKGGGGGGGGQASPQQVMMTLIGMECWASVLTSTLGTVTTAVRECCMIRTKRSLKLYQTLALTSLNLFCPCPS